MQDQEKDWGFTPEDSKSKNIFVRTWGNFYIRNIIFTLSMLLLLGLILTVGLMVYTRNGQYAPLPAFLGLSYPQAQQLATAHNLRIQIVDSVYIAHKTPGMVIEQNPKPDVAVKSNRRVFLTLNASNPKRMQLPNVVGLSLRQAKATLETHGFEVGKLAFVLDMASRNVLGQYYKGRTIEEGILLPSGTQIDLLVGKTSDKEQTTLPNLKGLTLGLAKSQIIDASLNIGNVQYDKSVKNIIDTMGARIYHQIPQPTDEQTITCGKAIDVFLTINPAQLDL
ncbi:MAG: PASTA domain-containing protein [Bacteroidales bacterium]